MLDAQIVDARVGRLSDRPDDPTRESIEAHENDSEHAAKEQECSSAHAAPTRASARLT